METVKDFSRALAQMKEWSNWVFNTVWNWLEKQFMHVAIQTPDENSKMSEPYLYMYIKNKETGKIKMRPRMPSMLDLLSDTWEISKQ